MTDSKPKLSRQKLKEKSGKLILQAAQKEFLANGFQNASIRTIAKDAGLSVGAVYVHFKDKNHLFEELVGGTVKGLEDFFLNSQHEFDDLAKKGQASRSQKLANEKLYRIIDYLYDHLDTFKLLKNGPNDNNISVLINKLANIHMELMEKYGDLIKSLNGNVLPIKPEVNQILNTSYFTAILEPLVQGMTKQQAIEYIDSIIIFFNAGWAALIRLQETRPTSTT